MINLYITNSQNIFRASCVLLQKCYEANFSTVVFMKNQDDIHMLDRTLWTFSRKQFIPHATCFDLQEQGFEKSQQKIYITNNQSDVKASKANVLLMFNILADNLTTDLFDKTMFISSDEDVIQKTNLLDSFLDKKQEINCYTQDAKGAWTKKEI